MSECTEAFSPEYVSSTNLETKGDLKEFQPDTENYGVTKPKRKIIRAKIVHE